jgi:hypothetical protein
MSTGDPAPQPPTSPADELEQTLRKIQSIELGNYPENLPVESAVRHLWVMTRTILQLNTAFLKMQVEQIRKHENLNQYVNETFARYNDVLTLIAKTLTELKRDDDPPFDLGRFTRM